MKNEKAYLVLRILFGLAFVGFGLMNILQLAPAPEFVGQAGEFMLALMDSGYIMQLNSVFMFLFGLSLLANKYVPMMAMLYAPFTLNQFLFHIFLDQATIAGSLVFTLFNLYLGYYFWDVYKPIFKPNSKI